MAMESLSKRNGTSMLDCETYKSIRNNPFYLPLPLGQPLQPEVDLGRGGDATRWPGLNCSCSLHCTIAKNL